MKLNNLDWSALHWWSNTRVGTIKEKTHNKQNTRSSYRCNHPQRNTAIIQHLIISKITAYIALICAQNNKRPTLELTDYQDLVKEVAREQNSKGEDHQ